MYLDLLDISGFFVGHNVEWMCRTYLASDKSGFVGHIEPSTADSLAAVAEANSISLLLFLIPYTHHRRRRDSNVELSRVGVASVSAVCIEFATSSRRLPTKIWETGAIWKLNILRIYPVELSCVGGVSAPVGCRDPVYNSAAYM